MTHLRDKKAGIRYIKKSLLKVDMTPMVDLGFLLITFFVFTAEIVKPREMLLKMPADSPDSSNIGNEKVLTVILVDNKKVLVYHGNWKDALQSGAISETSYSTRDGFGRIIRQKQLNIDQMFGKAARNELMLLIKPSKNSTYQNVIDALDEVLINSVKKYAIIELTAEEKIYIEKVK